jgi:hypothetical protein
LAPAGTVAALARGVEALEAQGWPATFILAFDEAWALLEQAAALVREATGNEPNLDVLAWKVDPARGQGGFSPHRDRQPADVEGSFRGDRGSARYVTCWMALSDATPENSCLYCVPADADPGYFFGDREDVDPLTRALGGKKENYQLIRALPCEAGGAVVFTHRLIHWGSRNSGDGGGAPPPPRLSLAMAASDPGFEPPYFSPDLLPNPPLRLRVALAAAQMIAYYQRFDVSAPQLRLFRELYEMHQSEFHPTYRQKVLAELVGASEEALRFGGRGADGEGRGKTEEEEEDDVLDEALERILEVEAGGEGGDFDDDFDLAASSGEEGGEGEDEDEEEELERPSAKKKKLEAETEE